MSQPDRILIVEDEQHLAEGLRFNLEAEGYQVQAVDTGEAALQLLIPLVQDVNQTPFDLVVLDVMLPVKDGFTVVSEMRGAGQFVPTLMLTARGRPEDVLEGFAAGADDYLPKPFELSILIARIRSLLRRKQWLRSSAPAAGAPKAAKDSFAFGEKSIHFDLLEVHAGGKVYPLTLMEASILRFLIDHEGKAVSRKSMLQ
jgi:two-component system, OmpR family, alkaline phosphatase synthesis response regulator PhoP